jgi:hypothetical protein
MKALVYHGAGKRALENMPRPEIKSPTDAIVRITKTTICGTDLHIMKGDVPEVENGGFRQTPAAAVNNTSLHFGSSDASLRYLWECNEGRSFKSDHN